MLNLSMRSRAGSNLDIAKTSRYNPSPSLSVDRLQNAEHQSAWLSNMTRAPFLIVLVLARIQPRSLTLSVCLALLAWPQSACAQNRWKLIWSDEFNGPLRSPPDLIEVGLRRRRRRLGQQRTRGVH
jgi:hypothetical protein